MSKKLKEMAADAATEWIKGSETDNSLVDASAMYGYNCGFLAGYQAAAPQWISVRDRLPEEGQDCVIYVDWVDVWDKGSERITYQEIAVFNGEDRFYHRSHTELNRVTYWMPLPAAPNEKA